MKYNAVLMINDSYVFIPMEGHNGVDEVKKDAKILADRLKCTYLYIERVEND